MPRWPPAVSPCLTLQPNRGGPPVASGLGHITWSPGILSGRAHSRLLFKPEVCTAVSCQEQNSHSVRAVTDGNIVTQSISGVLMTDGNIVTQAIISGVLSAD